MILEKMRQEYWAIERLKLGICFCSFRSELISVQDLHLKSVYIHQYRKMLPLMVRNYIAVRQVSPQPPIYSTDKAVKNNFLLIFLTRSLWSCFTQNLTNVGLSAFWWSTALKQLELLFSESHCCDGLLVDWGFVILDGSVGIGLLRMRCFILQATFEVDREELLTARRENIVDRSCVQAVVKLDFDMRSPTTFWKAIAVHLWAKFLLGFLRFHGELRVLYLKLKGVSPRKKLKLLHHVLIRQV